MHPSSAEPEATGRPAPPSQTMSRVVLLGLVSVSLILGTNYSITTPLWEAPDEPSHFHYINYLLDQRALPQPGGFDTWHHPPLYHLIAALVISPVEMSDYINWRRPNPRSFIVDQTNPTDGPPNIQLHAVQELPPYRDIALAVHLARAVNVIFGAITVAATYLLGRKLFPQTLWIAFGAACVVAFNPQFLFMSGSINNDLSLAASFALALLPAANIVQGDYRTRQFLWLGAQTGLTILFKQSGLTLVAVVGVVLLYAAWQSKRWQNLLRWGLWVGGPILLLTAPFYIRNWRLYGDPFAYQAFLAYHPPVPERSLFDVIGKFSFYERMHQTFWGYFGWANVPLPQFIYQLLWLLYPIALLGLFFWLWRGRSRWPKPANGLAMIAILGIVIVTTWLFPIRQTWVLGAFGMQGRYLFQLVSALGLLISLGFFSLLPGSWRAWPVIALSIALFLLAAWTPLRLIGPTYEYLGDSPQILETVQYRRGDVFADMIELAGYSVDVDEAAGQMQLRFFWRTLQMPPEDYTIFVHLIDEADNKLGQDDRRPLDGAFPTNLWRPGDVLHTEHVLPAAETCSQIACYLVVGFYHLETGERLAVTAGLPFGDAVRVDEFLVALRQ